MIPQRLQQALALSLALFGTLACALTVQPDNPTIPQDIPDAATGVPEITLASPLDGAAYQPDVPVNILARVSNAGEDIDRVEVLVDDTVVQSVPLPNPAGAPVFPLAQVWTAEGSGPRTLSVVVYRVDGSASQPATRTIEIAGAAPAVVTGSSASGGNTTASEDNPRGGGGLLSGLFGGSGNNTETATADTSEAATPPPPVDENNEADTEEEATSPPPPIDENNENEADTEEAAAPPPPEPTTPLAVTTTGVNVRGGPGTSFAAIGSFAAGTQTALLAVNSNRSWYKLQYYNGEGWVAASLLEIRNADNLPIDDGPPPPTPTLTPAPATEVPTTAPSNRNIAFSDIPQGFAPFPPGCGQTMNITLRLQNTGSDSLGTSSAAIVRDIHVDSGTVTETTIPVPDISPGESVEVTGGFLTVETNVGSTHRIEIQLDANEQITESDEGDNLFSGGLEYTLGQGSC
jgi:hypothetical protein